MNEAEEEEVQDEVLAEVPKAQDPKYVIMKHDDYLNLRKLIRRFPIVKQYTKNVKWLNCWDKDGNYWHGVNPQDWMKVETIIKAYPRIHQAAIEYNIDVMYADDPE